MNRKDILDRGEELLKAAEAQAARSTNKDIPGAERDKARVESARLSLLLVKHMERHKGVYSEQRRPAHHFTERVISHRGLDGSSWDHPDLKNIMASYTVKQSAITPALLKGR